MKLKKLLSILSATVLLLTCIPLGAVSVSAATYGDLTYEITDGEVTITGYTDGLPADLVIPATIQGYPVTTIRYGAFYYCYNLTAVTIPDSVTTIGDSTFHGCESLTAVTIPDSVTTIGYGAFYYCYNLTWVTIPDSVTTIGEGAFGNCDSLTSITVSAENPNYSSVDGVLFNKKKTTLIQYPGGKAGAYTIPDSVTTIGDGAFEYCDSLTEVTIGDSVTTIGDWAFGWCESLTTVTIPDGVTTIGSSTFRNCSSLTTVTIPDSVTTIGNDAFYWCTSLTDVYYTGSEADRAAISISYGNTNLTNATWHYNAVSAGLLYSIVDGEVTITGYTDGLPADLVIPDTIEGYPVTTIDEDAFYWCTRLTSVTIPDSVTTIGDRAFFDCWNLTSVTIGDSVTAIGDWAFAYCDRLTSVIIPDSVTTIGENVFYCCIALTTVYVGKSLQTIGEEWSWPYKWGGVFDGCNALANIIVSENNSYYSSADGVVYSADGTNLEFCPRGKEEAVTVPEGTITMSESAFEECSKLPAVSLPDSVINISYAAFANCATLTEVDVPDSVISIGDDAFYGCNSLTSVTIGDSVTTIGEEAFWGCESLTAVIIPDSVTSIGDWAFFDCYSLTDVYYTGSEIDRAAISVGSNNSCLTNATWHYNAVSAGLLYSIVDGEVTITGYTDGLPADLVIPATIQGYPVTTIGDYAFAYCTGLTAVTIPDSVTTIGEEAFEACDSLTWVTIPDSVTTIGDWAFADCTSLTTITVSTDNPNYSSVDGVLFNKNKTILIQCPGGKTGAYTIPDSVTTISDWAFSNCDSLTAVTIGDSVTTIGYCAFEYCTSLTTVTIPDSVTTIRNWAFWGCDSLTDVYYTGSEIDRAAISVGSNNSCLTNATWHYNCINPKDHYSPNVQHSVMDTEHGTGLAFRFDLAVEGMAVVRGTVADYTNATVNYLGTDCKLVGMGAVLTNSAAIGEDTAALTLDSVNGSYVLDIPAVYLCNLEPDSCAFAVRVTNIPAEQVNTALYVRPYYIVEVDGELITVYGDINAASCAEYM